MRCCKPPLIDPAHAAPSELTSIKVSTLSMVSKAVQKDALIRRKRTQVDQRTVRVTLTHKGRELVQKIIPATRMMQEKILGHLPAEQARAQRADAP